MNAYGTTITRRTKRRQHPSASSVVVFAPARRCFQGRSHRVDQFQELEGFLNEPDQSLACEAAGRFLLTVTGCKDDFRVGTKPTYLSESFFTAQPGHGHIQQDNVDFARPLAKRFHGLYAVFSQEDVKTFSDENSPGDIPYALFIVDDQNRAASLPVPLGLAVLFDGWSA